MVPKMGERKDPGGSIAFAASEHFCHRIHMAKSKSAACNKINVYKFMNERIFIVSCNHHFDKEAPNACKSLGTTRFKDTIDQF